VLNCVVKRNYCTVYQGTVHGDTPPQPDSSLMASLAATITTTKGETINNDEKDTKSASDGLAELLVLLLRGLDVTQHLHAAKPAFDDALAEFNQQQNTNIPCMLAQNHDTVKFMNEER
jgi:hypothetical protein